MKTVVVFFSSASGELADASFMVEATLQRNKSFLAAAGTAEGKCGRAVMPQTALAMSFWVAWAWQWLRLSLWLRLGHSLNSVS